MEEGSFQRIQAREGAATYQQDAGVNLPGEVASAEDKHSCLRHNHNSRSISQRVLVVILFWNRYSKQS